MIVLYNRTGGSLMKNEILNVSQSSIAQALAADYFCIYYVDVETDRFIEYSASDEYRQLGLPQSGDDLITFARNSFEALVHTDDQEMFLDTFTKENIIRNLDRHGIFTMTFRMMFQGTPVYVHLKMTRMIEKEARHVVIGISSVDEQMKARRAFDDVHHARITYSRVAQALAGDYFSIYAVDPDTDHFIEYSADHEYEKLGVEKEGDDFFETSRRNMSRLIYEEDRDRFMGTFFKEKIMSILERDGRFTMKYRLMFGDDPVYVSMKATLLEDEHGRHLIIGTNNIDAQMKREQEYQKKMAEARTSARNDFLANMSHDIRTPMNAIIGYANIARNSINDPDAVMNAIERIGSSSHFLLSLINDILDISKIESGRMTLNAAPCDLNALFRRIEDITALQAKDKSLQITYDRSTLRHAFVIADELRIEQILINIISNAIKYTPAGKTVDLVCEEQGETDTGKIRYRFIVRDTGIGISEDYLPHIFESFTREENTLTNRVQGTGLGLAITARVVELMGGTIGVQSRPGEGSVFTVVLDLAPAEEMQAETGETEQIDLSGRRILLAEDNMINAEIAAMVLKQNGMTVTHVMNGREAVDTLRMDQSYDAVLMDIQMPLMNGYEAARAIRSCAAEYYQNIPVIAMSANAYDEDVRECLKAGMNAHIAKPFSPDELLSLLHQWICRNDMSGRRGAE